MEYTVKDRTRILEYVTHRPLAPSEATASNDHGVYPVNPIGFPYVSTCDDDAKCISKGNPEFPQNKNFGVSWDSLRPEGITPVVISTNVAELNGLGLTVPVEILRTESFGDTEQVYTITVSGDIRNLLDPDPNMGASRHRFYLVDAGFEKYSITKLVGEDDTPVYYFATNTALDDNNNTIITFEASDATVRGTIGPMRLNLVVEMENGEYILLTAQKDKGENGLYLVQDDIWPRLAPTTWYDGSEQLSAYCGCHITDENAEEGDDPCEGYNGGKNPYCSIASLDNSPTCGHYRHGYSDREVAEEVMARCGSIIENAIHPMSVAGDLAGAGSMTKWFIECGKVNFGGSSNGGRQVVIDGFGLGGAYSGECTYGDQCGSVHDRTEGANEEPERPWLTFSIGARKPDENSEVETLPKDWPFTAVSDYATDDVDNNITLLKQVVNLTDDTVVGGLESDIYEDCEKCDGTGEFDGHECPVCGGVGRIIVAHRLTNRIHVCVNNDFKQDADKHLVFKKTYIHLPADLGVKDGDEYEITVSLPTLNTVDAFTGMDPVDAQRAYYAFISQPRVIVMGGYWKFSDTDLRWKLDANTKPAIDGFVIPSEDGVLDKDGTLLPEGTRVRFNFDGGNNCPRYTDMTGTLLENEPGHVRIGELINYPYGNRLRDRNFRICGMAYLDKIETEHDELNNYTDVPLGLHSRNEVTLGDDRGDGGESSLNHLNKFISPIKTSVERPGRDYITENDARQVLATVYPTATNTFQWNIVGRHKLKHLDELMTDEWDLGQNSVSKLIWKANREILDRTDTISFFGPALRKYAFSSEAMPLRYAVENSESDVSTIGSQLRVTIPTDGSFPASAQPVRQARKAAKMLCEDFQKLRIYHGDTPTLSGSSYMRYSDEGIETAFDEGKLNEWWGNDVATLPSDAVKNNDMASAAWLIKARHLPQYIVMSGMDEYSNKNSLIGIDPFANSETAERYVANPYETTEYETSDATDTIPCSERIYGDKVAYGYRSIITARLETDADAVSKEMYNDAVRVTELQRVRIGGNFNPIAPYEHLVDSSSYEKWMDIFSATANVFSIDTIPSPDGLVASDFADLHVEQFPMMTGEPFALYRLLNEDVADIDSVADNLPFYDTEYPRSDALTKVLRNMVVPYSSKMPLRWWDSNRIGLPKTAVETTSNFIYLSRLVWAEEECDGGLSTEVRGAKVDDEFISRGSTAKPLDPNWNRITFDEDGEVYVHDNWSAPPMKVSREWYNKAPFVATDERFVGPTGYIRVFMKFKFSTQAGRWYPVDYIQAPMSYLSPLYGAAALEEKVDGKRLWVESMCAPCGGWQEALMHPYFKYTPMDLNTNVVPNLVEGTKNPSDNDLDVASSTTSLPRLRKPFMSVENGGLGLSAPIDVNGNRPDDGIVTDMPHANFWSVRTHLRPATSIVAGSDIPGFGYVNGAITMGRSGGVSGDAVLWGQYSFPKKSITEYKTPDPMQGVEEPGTTLVDSEGYDITYSDDETYVEVS